MQAGIYRAFTDVQSPGDLAGVHSEPEPKYHRQAMFFIQGLNGLLEIAAVLVL